MKKTFKSAIALLIFTAIVFSSASGAFAIHTEPVGVVCQRDSTGAVSVSVKKEMPAYYDAVPEFSVTGYENLVQAVHHQFMIRDTSFTLRFNADESVIEAMGETIYDDVFAYDDPATTSDLDYLHYSIVGMLGYSGKYKPLGANSYGVFTFEQTFITTESQENYVNNTVASILDELGAGGLGAYLKIKAVHDYIVAHVEYDKTLTKYSAYEALFSGETVCQGYALLTYKMLTELGVPVRIITGYGQGEDHAWNIVKIGQSWFNYDVTWDDTSGQQTRWFLKNDTGFSDHVREDEYKTAAFNAQHPMSPQDYSNLRLVQAVSFQESAGTYQVGDTFMLRASVAPDNAANKSLVWSTSDRNVATVDGAGVVTVAGAGTAVISATAADGSQVTAAFTVTAREVEQPSGWAKAEIDALTARGVVPQALTAGYKDAISRGEFTALIVNVYEYAMGQYTLQEQTPFTDIGDSIYALPISKGYELSIIGGTSTTTFTPEGTLTREQCAKIISAAAGVINGTSVTATVELPFPDAGTIDNWALEYVRYAFENGLMTGTGENFEPLVVLPREQALVIAERMIVKYGW